MNFFHPETLTFWTTLFFLLFAFLFFKMAWKPILKTIDEREKSIEDALAEAEKAKEEMAKLQADNQKILNEARAERDLMLKEAKELKTQIVNKAKEEAQVEAHKEIEKAKAIIQSEKQAAVKDLKNQVAEYSLVIAEKVLKSELKDQVAQKNHVEQLISDIKLN